MIDVIQNWFEEATLWDWMTNMSALVSMVLLTLVIIGFRRYIKRPRSQPIDYIGTGLWAMCLVVLLRPFFWDVIPDLLPFDRWSDVGIFGHNVNWLFNIGVIIACWLLLKGYHLLVEKQAPGRYNILTAVFYPKRLRLWIIARGENDNE